MDQDLRALIDRCFERPDDRDSLESLDAALRPLLLAILVAMYRRDPTLAEDAYQSAFVKYVQIFRGGLDPKIDYVAYLVAVAKNCLVDEIRKTKRYVSIDEVIGDSFVTSGAHEARIIEARITVLQAMMRLNRRCQFILESYYIDEMDSGELARRLRVQPESVHMAIKRCRDELRNLIFSR